MEQRTATGGAGRLLPGQRCETPAQMKAFIHDAVGLHLLGQYPYKEEEDLIAALEMADNNKKAWGRQRLDYQIRKIMNQMASRSWARRWQTSLTASRLGKHLPTLPPSRAGRSAPTVSTNSSPRTVCAEQVEEHTRAIAAKDAQIRELQAANAAKDARIAALTP